MAYLSFPLPGDFGAAAFNPHSNAFYLNHLLPPRVIAGFLAQDSPQIGELTR